MGVHGWWRRHPWVIVTAAFSFVSLAVAGKLVEARIAPPVIIVYDALLGAAKTWSGLRVPLWTHCIHVPAWLAAAWLWRRSRSDAPAIATVPTPASIGSTASGPVARRAYLWGIDWHYSWDGQEVSDLKGHCPNPNCRGVLRVHRAGGRNYPEDAVFSCRDSGCGFHKRFGFPIGAILGQVAQGLGTVSAGAEPPTEPKGSNRIYLA